MSNILMDEDESERRSSCCSTSQPSPEFEFWVPHNPASFPHPDQLPTADKLFVNGVLLPLDSNHPVSQEKTPPLHVLDTSLSSDESASILNSSTGIFGSSKRWKDIIFKKANISNSQDDDRDIKEKEKKVRKRERRSGSSSSELVISIWPFARSRSAGNDSTRPKPSVPGPTRKVSSAPCSRSNSSGESKTRKFPKSPGRAHGGVHVGRTSPVWQARRKSSNIAAGEGESSAYKNANIKQKAKILNITVPLCIGYKANVNTVNGSCSSTVSGDSGKTSSASIVRIRSLFARKVH